MKKLLCFFLALVTALSLCACGGGAEQTADPTDTTAVSQTTETTPTTTAPVAESYLASDADIALLETLYGGRIAFHGELHDHSNSGGTSDGKQPLNIWKATMPGVGMDYAAILDHRQVLHMYLPEWDPHVFIGGSEAATTITDRPEGSNRFHYNMVFATPEPLVEIVTEFTEFKYREWTEEDRAGCGGQMHFNYPSMKAERFNEIITAVKEKGGLFVIPHPSSTNEEVPENAMDLYFQDYVGYEVFYGYGAEDNNNPKTEANYKLWTDMLAAGARVWCSAGNDMHQFPQAKCLSTVYSEEAHADSHITHLRVGDFAPGHVGIQMCVGNTAMGSSGPFEGQRLVFRVGDFHSDIALERYTFRVTLMDDKGVVFSEEMNGTECKTFAIDANKSAKFYRVEIYNITLDKLQALGNPIWNEAKYE